MMRHPIHSRDEHLAYRHGVYDANYGLEPNAAGLFDGPAYRAGYAWAMERRAKGEYGRAVEDGETDANVLDLAQQMDALVDQMDAAVAADDVDTILAMVAQSNAVWDSLKARRYEISHWQG